MALTRKFLKAMGIDEEKVEQIVEAHSETVNGLKDQLAGLRADAEKLPDVQKELDALKAAGDGGFEEKYQAEHRAFEEYKSQVSAKERKTAQEAAARGYFQSKNITGKALEIAMRGSAGEISALELEDGKIKDPAALDALINGDFSALVGQTVTQGADTPTPPAGGTGGGDSVNPRAAQLYTAYHSNLYGETKKE